MSYFIIVLILAFSVWYIFFLRLEDPISSKCFYLDQIQITSEELFPKIKSEVEIRKLPVQSEIESLFENGVLTSRREYLRFNYLDYTFDISTGFYGNGSYVAWCISSKRLSLFNRLPVIGVLMGKSPDFQSYYRSNTQASFQAILRTILETEIDAYAEPKGVRPLVESFDTNKTK